MQELRRGLLWTLATLALVAAAIGSAGLFDESAHTLLPLLYGGLVIAIPAIGVNAFLDDWEAAPFLVFFSSVAAVIYLGVGLDGHPGAALFGAFCAIDAIAGLVFLRRRRPPSTASLARQLRREIVVPTLARDAEVVHWALVLRHMPGHEALLAEARPRLDAAERRMQQAALERQRSQPNVYGIEASYGITLPAPFKARWMKGHGMLPPLPNESLPLARKIRNELFADEQVDLPFLPFQREGDSILGLWIAQARPDGDFAVLRVTGAEVTVVAQSTAEWLA